MVRRRTRRRVFSHLDCASSPAGPAAVVIRAKHARARTHTRMIASIRERVSFLPVRRVHFVDFQRVNIVARARNIVIKRVVENSASRDGNLLTFFFCPFFSPPCTAQRA